MPLLRGELIRSRRRALGVKVGAFAERVEASRSHMINIENGGRPASFELTHRIARELGVAPEDLLVPVERAEGGAR